MSGARFVITGTDTDIGKTVFAAALTGALGASYWKPIQSGLDSETDSQTVARLSPATATKILPEAYRLATPASPHLSAEIDGVVIDAGGLNPPDVDGPLVIEGAGGLLVPLSRQVLTIEIFARWGLPTILCARTRLGAINHALLSLRALATWKVPLAGVVFIGDEMADTQATIATFSGARILGRLPRVDPLNPESLRAAFAAHFNLADFTS